MAFLSFPTAVLPVLIMGCGAFYLFKLRFFFFSHPIKTVRAMISESAGLRALSLSLAGTLGVGNIVGVAVAISLGGAGAVFWMWASALIAAVLKYAEIVLAVKYREVCGDGYRGGPMYYMKNGVGGNFGRILAAVFALIGVVLSFVLGNLVQSRAAVGAVQSVVNVPSLAVGATLALLCAASIFGGYGTVSRVTSVIVPIMSGAYIVIALKIVISNAATLPDVIEKIFSSAFTPSSAGGGIVGFFTGAALRHGVAKGAYSHEAGGGTAPLSHAQAKTKSPAGEGLLGLFEVFFDTIVICTLTAFVILLYGGDGVGMALVSDAFAYFCGDAGRYIVAVAIVFFAFSTLICWGFYGKTCLEYLCKSRRVGGVYLAAYCAFVVVGALVGEARVWMLTDFGVAVMTAVNLVAVVALWRDVKAETELLGFTKFRR